MSKVQDSNGLRIKPEVIGEEVPTAYSKAEVTNSIEFQNYLLSFSDLNKLDEILLKKVKNAIKTKVTTTEEFEIFFTKLIDKEKEANSLDYLKKIGFSDPATFYKKRYKQFNIMIPKCVNKLNTKYSFLKMLSEEEFVSFFSERNADRKTITGYLACVDQADAKFWNNLWHHGLTFAQTVFQQTIIWCNVIHNDVV